MLSLFDLKVFSILFLLILKRLTLIEIIFFQSLLNILEFNFSVLMR